MFLLLFGGSTRSYPTVKYYVLPEIFRTECSVVNGVEQCLGLDLISTTYPVNFLGMELFVRPLYFIIFLLSLVLMAGLWFIVQRTKVGRAMRAVSEDKNTASLMGVNVDRIIIVTFYLGRGVGGRGGRDVRAV